MKRILLSVFLLFASIALTACSGGSDNSSQNQSEQTQIQTLQAQLADVKAQLASAQSQREADSAGIATAITSLTQTESSLNQLLSKATVSASAQQR